ncbi:alpha/beta hydrolase [Microbacterium sp.]|uniref:alpha/beta fold hydrolase n=1 Tax=Microbacterium sp. TaxID=51671 RepID=UPI00068BCF05|nr:alpha/beta hydrolase [Microbacterium sp.]MCV0333241.1 alpha/beta hydrolase [Microbacterium sp.]MCV0375686.1 alpha/beta hydrolase [Microbacterium sp.]MCV0388959.1 alpha/beta hydrolase [Microbacterium sp.]MCV0417487.1 alpha/beta hydrolase [Microbacterium sp.]MCV0420798.1 alpha/beta hydrolase [Microbacterium sp.]
MVLHFLRVCARAQNVEVAIDISEFSYLPAQAEALGVPFPAVERLTLPLPDGRTLSALRFGTDEPRVTLLHGAGLNAHTWDTTSLALQQPLLAIDLAGHGDSSWRDDIDYTPRTLARDVAAALDAWATQPQVVVGQSLGGLTGAALAAARPDLVAELIIVDITPGIDVTAGPAALREFYAGPTDFATRDELVDKAIALGFGGSRPETERGVFLNTRVREDGRVEWKHHFAHLAAQALAAHDPGSATAPSVLHETGWDDLAAVSAPITLVRAARGFVSEADAAELQRRVPAAQLVVLDATHNVQETAPTALAGLIGSAAPAAGI